MAVNNTVNMNKALTDGITDGAIRRNTPDRGGEVEPLFRHPDMDTPYQSWQASDGDEDWDDRQMIRIRDRIRTIKPPTEYVGGLGF